MKCAGWSTSSATRCISEHKRLGAVLAKRFAWVRMVAFHPGQRSFPDANENVNLIRNELRNEKRYDKVMPKGVGHDRYSHSSTPAASSPFRTGAAGLDEMLQKSLVKKQKYMSHFRQAMAHLAEAAPLDSVAVPPPRRAARDGREA